MTFDAKVYRVLVASPGDVGDERSMIPEVIAEWNAVNSFTLKVVLLPVKWEENSFPELGGRPQSFINKQIVNDCDLLVGVFWTRIGTDTGTHVSGTVEEIEHFVKSGKPSMLYFSQSPVDPDKIDLKQLEGMRNFREEMRIKGLSENYSGIADFRNKFARQLTYRMNSTLESARRPSVVASVGRAINSALPAPKKVVASERDALEYVVEAIRATTANDGWASVSAVGKYLKTYTPFDYKDGKFRTLTSYLKSVESFEIKQEKRSERAQALDSAFVRIAR